MESSTVTQRRLTAARDQLQIVQQQLQNTKSDDFYHSQMINTIRLLKERISLLESQLDVESNPQVTLCDDVLHSNKLLHEEVSPELLTKDDSFAPRQKINTDAIVNQVSFLINRRTVCVYVCVLVWGGEGKGCVWWGALVG